MRTIVPHIPTKTFLRKWAHPPCIRHVVEALREIGLDCHSLLVLHDAHVKLPQLDNLLFYFLRKQRHQYSSPEHAKAHINNLRLNFAEKPGNKRRRAAGGSPGASGSPCTPHCSAQAPLCNPLRCNSVARSPGACLRQLNHNTNQNTTNHFDRTELRASAGEQGRVSERLEPWRGFSSRAPIAAPSCCGRGWGGGSG
jgi:hypothetical protein